MTTLCNAGCARAAEGQARRLLHLVAAILVIVGAADPSLAQDQRLGQRGFIEITLVHYPQTVPADQTRWIGDGFLRQEASWRATSWLSLGGGVEARVATDDRVDRSWSIDWRDRGLRRPALGIRSLSAVFSRGGLTVEAGKLFVRWGKADVLNPTDRFAPRDLLEVVDNDFLGVTAARARYERGPDTLDLVWVPLFTPSRVPLAGSRWAGGGSDLSGAAALTRVSAPPVADLGSVFPAGSQAGIRWNHVGSRAEYSFSYFDGFDHFPRFDVNVNTTLGRAELRRVYPAMRMAGADAAWPLRWFTVKGEAGYFWTTDPRADDYGILVVQVERQQGEWLFVGGYGGEFATRVRATTVGSAYVFDRELANTFLGRASLTIGPVSSLAIEGAVRHDISGGWVRVEYSRAAGQHWRATARADLLAGDADDFFGRYRRNSSIRLTARYSY